MAASPALANGHDSTQPSEKWMAAEQPADVAMPPVDDLEGPNPSRPDDRPTAPVEDRSDDPMSSTTFESGGKPDIVPRGEKQIKVLVRSSFVSAVHPYLFDCAHSSSSVRVSPLLFSLHAGTRWYHAFG